MPQPVKEMRLHQIGCDHAGAIFTRDAGEQELPGIRGSHLARLLGAVERERIGAEFFAPKRFFEALGQPPRLGFELRRLSSIPSRKAQRAASRLAANTYP